MHRTIPVSRLLGWSSVLTVLFLVVGAASAQDLIPVNLAQEPAPPPRAEAAPSVVLMTPGTTHTHTSAENLKKVENPNPKIINVSAVAGDPRKVLFEALSPGKVRVKLTDIKERVEFVDVMVVSDRVKELRDALARLVPTAAVQVATTNGDNTVILTGYVLTNADARVVQMTAAQLFGANVINNVQIGGVQQVQLEVVVAVVNRSLTRNMSFSWVNNSVNTFVGSIFPGGQAFANDIAATIAGGASNATSSSNLPFGIINRNSAFSGYLNALRTEGLLKILAEPRVTTLSGRPAYFTSGGQVPVILPGSGGGPPTIEYKPFGTVVNFLPIVLGNGKIHLEVRPELSSVNAALSVVIPGAAGGGVTTAPGFDSRFAQVAVQIEDGQTLAIGGLIQNTTNATLQKVPVLGDLPFLGVAFTSKNYSTVEEEMIILVTPRLVDPVECCKIPKYLPGRETRVPDDYELFLEGIIEAPRGPRSVVLHPHYYQAAYKHAPNGGQSPCLDGSCGPNCGPVSTYVNGGMPSFTPGVSYGSNRSTPVTYEPETMPSIGTPVQPTPTSNPGRRMDVRQTLPPSVSFNPPRQ